MALLTTHVTGRSGWIAMTLATAITVGIADTAKAATEACTDELPSARLIAHRCSAGEIVTGDAGHRLIATALAPLDRVALALRRVPGAHARIEHARRQTLLAQRALAYGSICVSAARTRSAASTVRTIHAAGPPIAPTPNHGDADEADLERAVTSARRQALRTATTAARALSQTLQRVCSKVHVAKTWTGRVTRVDDRHRMISLSGTRAVWLPLGARAGHLAEGSRVAVHGRLLGNGSMLATRLVPRDRPLPRGVRLHQPGAGCIQPRILPVQQPSPTPGGLKYPERHLPAGYEQNGTLWLEADMHLSAKATDGASCQPPHKPGAIVQVKHQYRLRIELTYYDTFAGKTFTTTLGLALPHHGIAKLTPGWIKAALDPMRTSTLTVTTLRRTCGHDCGPLKALGTTAWPVRILRRGDYATAKYVTRIFNLEDTDMTTFAATKLLDLYVTSVIPASANVQFRAGGYQVSGGSSTRPSVAVIDDDDVFAIYNDHGFHPKSDYPGLTSPDDLLAMTGVDHPAGLVWPRVQGTLNGLPFWYSAKLPHIVRDRIASCQYSPDSYYRLPWKAGETAVVTQGNNNTAPKASHKPGSDGAYAFDFVMPNLTAIHAARGGIVGQVVEGNSKQDHPNNPWDDGNKPNILRIDHQDGTASWYYHMVQGGVVPAVGDRVHRGEVVGWVGTTGRSTGPHLHIQAGSVYGKSALVRFEAKLVYGPLPCYVPTKGMALVSTNVKP